MQGISEGPIERSGETFEDLYRREFARAVRLAHLLTGSNGAADDIAQDAFLKLREKLPFVGNPSCYLTTTVVNLSKNWHRGRTRRSARELIGAVVEQPHDTEDHEILDIVDGLPFRQRTVLVARYWLDLPEAEIADLVGCRPGTVKSLASRALATLRKELQ